MLSRRTREYMMSYHAMCQRNESAADDGDGETTRTDAPASLSLQTTPAKIEKQVDDFETHRCAMKLTAPLSMRG